MLRDKIKSGWIAWSRTIDCFLAPHSTDPTFPEWDKNSSDALSTLRDIATKPDFWNKLSVHYSSENHSDVITQDNVSCVKSICKGSAVLPQTNTLIFCLIVVQLLGDEPLLALKPKLEELMANKDKNKQRAAAEFLAGVIAGIVCSSWIHCYW